MFGVLMITLLLTIALVGSNMDTILKQGIIFQVRSEITDNPSIAKSFNDPKDFEKFVQQKIDERIKALEVRLIDQNSKQKGIVSKEKD